MLGLAAAVPRLRRIDLEVNYRCPSPVIARAVRLVSHNRERFAKRIRAGPRTAGRLVLAADPADEPARARRLLRAWAPALAAAQPVPSHAVLARTNAELAPYAAVALELGLPYRAEADSLELLDDDRHAALLRSLASADRWLPALARARRDAHDGARDALEALLAWAPAQPSPAALAAAIEAARSARIQLRRTDAPLVLATVHGTKGLEFDIVACIGLDEGRFPSQRALAEAADPARALEEERRLAYVAWTRARRELLLGYDPGAPSRFLREAFEAEELAHAGRGNRAAGRAS